ncbi:MAG TPA: Spy/CpxP family protein refolding chaperone [Burkholderiaceae bacterium]
MNKLWLKRAVVGVAASVALVGSLAAWSQGSFQAGPPTAADMAAHEAHMLEHIGRTLDLDAAQQGKLQALATQLHAQHAAMIANDPHQRLQALMAGSTFDRAGAQALVDEKVSQLQANSPALIAAVGDFFDSLNPTQQQQVRDFLARHHRGHGWHGPHAAPADD